MKDWYFLLNGDIIVDAIEYPVDGYINVQLTETQFPAGINAGYYRWKGDHYEIDSVLKEESDKLAAGELGVLKAENAALNQQLAQVNGNLSGFIDQYYIDNPDKA